MTKIIILVLVIIFILSFRVNIVTVNEKYGAPPGNHRSVSLDDLDKKWNRIVGNTASSMNLHVDRT